MTLRDEARTEAHRLLPVILGMTVHLVLDTPERPIEDGKLCRCPNGAWQVNDHPFDLLDLVAFHCRWIDLEHRQTDTTIVIAVGPVRL